MRISFKPVSLVVLVSAISLVVWSLFNLPKPQQALAVATDKAGNSYHSICIDYAPKQLLLVKYDVRGRRLWRQTFESSDFLDDNRGNMRNNILVGNEDIYVYLNTPRHGIELLDFSPADGALKWIKALPDLIRVIHQKTKTDGVILHALDRRSRLVRKIINRAGDQATTQAIMPIPDGYSVQVDAAENIVLSDLNGRELSLRKYDPQGSQLWTHKIHAVELVGFDRENSLYLAGYNDETLIKYSPAGDWQWTLCLNKPFGRGFEMSFDPSAVIADQDGLYLAGMTAKLDVRKNVYVNHKTDIFLCRIGRDGKSQWLKTMRVDDYFSLGGVGLDARGNVHLNGQYAFLDVRDRFFAAKYAPDGRLVWRKRDFKPTYSMVMCVFFLMIALFHLLERKKQWKAMVIINLVLSVFYSLLASVLPLIY